MTPGLLRYSRKLACGWTVRLCDAPPHQAPQRLSHDSLKPYPGTTAD